MIGLGWRLSAGLWHGGVRCFVAFDISFGLSNVNNTTKPLPLFNMTASLLLTLLLLALCTWGELAIEALVGVNRPYTIFYLIPVAVGAALLGIRGGILTALAALLLARVYLFHR